MCIQVKLIYGFNVKLLYLFQLCLAVVSPMDSCHAHYLWLHAASEVCLCFFSYVHHIYVGLFGLCSIIYVLVLFCALFIQFYVVGYFELQASINPPVWETTWLISRPKAVIVKLGCKKVSRRTWKSTLLQQPTKRWTSPAEEGTTQLQRSTAVQQHTT